jgi:ABC-type multidrug transport system fused ATPase/permease subunit
VLNGILRLRQGRGVVWVAQRPDTAERFDVVLVMERGKLAEQGAFAELKSNGGPLHKLLAAA